MHSIDFLQKFARGATVAAFASVSGLAFGLEPSSPEIPLPVLVAQAGSPIGSGAPAAAATTHPAHEKQVRAAAAEGPDALRRYVTRTRMIWNFRYVEFAPKE